MSNRSKSQRPTISREELFARVWSAPSTEVAAKLGISDVGLGKLCRRLQVPKPSRGYWAGVHAGRTPRVPPLPAYRAELERRLVPKRGALDAASIRLPPRQRELLERALAMLKEADREMHGFELSGDRGVNLSPQLAAELVMLIENQWLRWVPPEATPRIWTAARQVSMGLLEKLRPRAKPHLLVLRSVDVNGDTQSSGLTVILRASAGLQDRIADLARLTSARTLAHVAAPLSSTELACESRYVYHSSASGLVRAELCVSKDAIWVHGWHRGYWQEDTFETERLRIADVFDIELVPEKVPDLSNRISARAVHPYAKRLKALTEAESLHESLTSGMYELAQALESPDAIVAELVAFGRTGTRPLSDARKAWAEFEAELELWDGLLDDARREIVSGVLGIQPGDTVLFRDGERATRILVDGASCWTYEGKVTFTVSGRRYRKDGQVGKRDETLYLRVSDAEN